MRQCLIEARFTPEGTSKISEGPKSIISLVISDRKWAFDDVNFLIRKGHDVNKGDELRELPFYEALTWGRYDIVKLLLLNGAQPILPTNLDDSM
jgi:ankyrin repeat protein